MLDVTPFRQPSGILEGRIILRKRKGVHVKLTEPHTVFPEFRLQHAKQRLADIVQMLIQRKSVHILHLQDTPQKCLDLCIQHTVELIAQALCRQLFSRSHKPDQHLLHLIRIRLHIHGSAGAHIQGHGLAGLHLQHHVHPVTGSPGQRHLHGQVYKIHLCVKIFSESQLCKKAQERKISCLQHMHARPQHLYELPVPKKHGCLGLVHIQPGSELKILSRAFPCQDIGAPLVYYHCSHTLPPPPLPAADIPFLPAAGSPDVHTVISFYRFFAAQSFM